MQGANPCPIITYEVRNMGNVSDLRKHCGVTPKITTEYYRGTKYVMYRVVCPVCGNTTQPKANIRFAVREWENPENVHLN